jgi:hypothetical protein
MNKDLIERIRVFNNIKYGTNDNETRIILATLKPKTKGTVTTAPKYK